MADEKQKATHQQHPSSSSTTSSASSSSTEQQQRGPNTTTADPPKIPPPPTEHPPPYTPFGGQSASLIPSAGGNEGAQGQTRNNRNPQRIVQPPGWRRHLRHLTLRNLLIGVALLVALCVFIYIIHWSNKSDEEMYEGRGPLEGTHKSLRVTHKGLGPVKGKRDRISFDEADNAVVLSEYDMDSRILRSEYVKLEDHLAGFAQHIPFNATQHWPDEFDDCMRFTKMLVCCSTPSQSAQHLTKCFLRDNGRQLISVASMFDFLPRWQTLVDGEQLLVVHNRQRQAVLDLKRNILLPIDENRMPLGYITKGFHFSTDTADGLAELVRAGEQLRVCDYIRTRQGDSEHGAYVLRERQCRETPFRVDFELSRTLFCANSLYTAVVQYGHMPGEQGTLSWRLRLQFDSSPRMVYSAHDQLELAHNSGDQMAIDCDDRRVDLFALNDHELHQFRVELPEVRNRHFGAKRKKR